jgi:hypothetical protein
VLPENLIPQSGLQANRHQTRYNLDTSKACETTKRVEMGSINPGYAVSRAQSAAEHLNCIFGRAGRPPHKNLLELDCQI